MSDKIFWSYEFEKGKELTAGSLLLSEPFMYDENFKRTVVLICDHTEENGTVGLTLNKPINLRLNDLVEEFPHFDGTVFLGGPVGTDNLQFLHRLGHKIENSIQLADNLYWGGDIEQVKELMMRKEIRAKDIRFFIGYSGWGHEQLIDELKENSWIIAKASVQYVFDSENDTLWKEVMSNMGGIYNTMARYPENPALN